MTDFQQKEYIAVWGALAGGLMSFVVNALFNIILPRMRRWNLTRKISIVADPIHEGFVRFRVVNGGYWTINDATLYITLEFAEADTLKPIYEGQDAWIKPGHFAPLSGDPLCWSVHSPKPNPMKVSIFAKERQPFAPCKIGPSFIEIPSEKG